MENFVPATSATTLPEISTNVGIVYLDSLAPHLPDPERPFWWFSSEPIREMKLPAGRAILESAGSRLPPEADYWCHEGAKEWVRVDRSVRPRPAPKPRKKTERKARIVD